MSEPAAVLRQIRERVANGVDLVQAIDDLARPLHAHRGAIDALYKCIPLRWRLRHGAWSRYTEIRRLDIRNYRLWLDRAQVLDLIDCALRKT